MNDLVQQPILLPRALPTGAPPITFPITLPYSCNLTSPSFSIGDMLSLEDTLYSVYLRNMYSIYKQERFTPLSVFVFLVVAFIYMISKYIYSVPPV